MAYGHIFASCSARKCRFCGSGEHEAKDCDEPKRRAMGVARYHTCGGGVRPSEVIRVCGWGSRSGGWGKKRSCSAGEREDCGGRELLQGTPEPNTIPASWVGVMEEEWGMSGVTDGVLTGRYGAGEHRQGTSKTPLGFGMGGFQALLREDPKGRGGYLHPPAMFSLGADRGTLFYARQPPFCRRCMAYGHIFASCSARKCRFCRSGEHEAKDCDEPKACHRCGSLSHLWRGCPARQRSYASVAGGEQERGMGEEEEVKEECLMTRVQVQRGGSQGRRRSKKWRMEERRKQKTQE
ncbi:DNA-binding protein HEXBP-like [Oncorhynchus nerka]|uniref:DNA-binding protein HEXBP-like n=1 Tax=Oncorhynchus nerka TaxID=8023 RepID=UPI0031B80085